MLGVMLGLGFAAAFGAASVITRRGVLRATPNYIATMSIFTGPVFFLLVSLLIGEIFRLGQFPWQSYVFFAISGIVHFALGRTFGYKALQLIGATRSNIVTGLNAIVSVALAVIVLQEVLTPLVAFGILLSLSGPLVMALKEETVTEAVHTQASPYGKEVDRRTLYLGLLYGAGSAIFWGSSAIFIKLGIEQGGSSIAGSLTAYATASLVISPSLFNDKTRGEIFHPEWKSLQLALMSGMCTNIAQMLRYLALAYSSVIAVSLMTRTVPIFTLLLSFIFNRKLESFGPWVLLGNALLLLGTVLVVVEQL